MRKTSFLVLTLLCLLSSQLFAEAKYNEEKITPMERDALQDIYIDFGQTLQFYRFDLQPRRLVAIHPDFLLEGRAYLVWNTATKKYWWVTNDNNGTEQVWDPNIGAYVIKKAFRPIAAGSKIQAKWFGITTNRGKNWYRLAKNHYEWNLARDRERPQLYKWKYDEKILVSTAPADWETDGPPDLEPVGNPPSCEMSMDKITYEVNESITINIRYTGEIVKAWIDSTEVNLNDRKLVTSWTTAGDRRAEGKVLAKDGRSATCNVTYKVIAKTETPITCKITVPAEVKKGQTFIAKITSTGEVDEVTLNGETVKAKEYTKLLTETERIGTVKITGKAKKGTQEVTCEASYNIKP